MIISREYTTYRTDSTCKDMLWSGTVTKHTRVDRQSRSTRRTRSHDSVAMTSSERSSEEQPIVAPPHRVSIGRGGRGNMSTSCVPCHQLAIFYRGCLNDLPCLRTNAPAVAPEEIKYELKKASSTDEYDGMFSLFSLSTASPRRSRLATAVNGIVADDTTALAEHTHRRSSSAWSLHSSSSDGTSKTEALKDFFRRGSQSKRKSTSQDGIAEGEEGVEEEEEKA